MCRLTCAVYCLLFLVFDVCCLLYVVGCWLFGVRWCLLFVVCLFGVVCCYVLVVIFVFVVYMLIRFVCCVGVRYLLFVVAYSVLSLFVGGCLLFVVWCVL